MKTTTRAIQGTVLAATIVVAGACHQSAGDGADGGGHYGADSVGVDECDSYLATYERCVDKAPAEQRTTMRENIKRNRAAWRTLAADPGARPGLAQSCKLARDSARTVTKAYGCDW